MGAALDASTLRRTMSLYLEALEEHREEIDSLNVFPVPDGDTGTNMLLTQRAVVEALAEAGDGSLGEVGETISRAALMGARGNSGVILSQILRGLCGGLSDAEARGEDLAAALGRADEEARSAVAKPVDGTILSVLHDAAGAAGEGDPAEVAEAAFRAAEESLARTPEQLEELRDAGVVDAGGKGLVLLLDALRAALTGGALHTEVGALGPVGHREPPASVASEYGSEVMYLLDGSAEDVARLRDALARIGDSVVVVGGGDLYNVHVHTDDPEAAVEAGREAGEPREVRVTSLDEQVAGHCVAGDGMRGVQPAAPEVEVLPIVAVAEGDGLISIFRSLGATVVEGGPGNNPSVGDLVDAVRRTRGDRVYVLPNHRNIWPAAEAAAREAGRPVEVVYTPSVPQGIAAALTYSPAEEDPGVGTSMFVSSEEAAAGAVARAEKKAGSPAGPVGPGDWVGFDFEDGEIHAVAASPEEAAARLVADRLGGADVYELATVYVGAEGADEEAERIADAIRERSDLEVEIHRGDQPRYPYLIGVE